MNLCFYGLRVCVAGEWPEAVAELGRDFAWFAAGEPVRADVEIVVERRAPDFDSLDGNRAASFITPRNVVYQQGDRSLIDYFGKALSIYERRRDRLLVQGEDLDLVHEAAYLFVLSRVGEHLERIGLPRLHALGLSGHGGAVAVMLPSGGGKSTLAVSALRAGGVKLLSEDSPLIDRHGMLHPFPLRIGVNPGDADRLPSGSTRTIARMEFGPKTLLELDTVGDRIEPRAKPLQHLVLGVRTLGTDASLEPLPRRSLAGPLLRECVVGVGLYQGMEFILQRGLRDVASKLGPARVRAGCAAAALAHARTWRLRLGRDHASNWSALAPLLS